MLPQRPNSPSCPPSGAFGAEKSAAYRVENIPYRYFAKTGIPTMHRSTVVYTVKLKEPRDTRILCIESVYTVLHDTLENDSSADLIHNSYLSTAVPATIHSWFTIQAYQYHPSVHVHRSFLYPNSCRDQRQCVHVYSTH